MRIWESNDLAEKEFLVRTGRDCAKIIEGRGLQSAKVRVAGGGPPVHRKVLATIRKMMSSNYIVLVY